MYFNQQGQAYCPSENIQVSYGHHICLWKWTCLRNKSRMSGWEQKWQFRKFHYQLLLYSCYATTGERVTNHGNSSWSSRHPHLMWQLLQVKKIQENIGECEQKLALECCKINLQKEVEATKASGVLPDMDGRVPIACSGDTGWQGNGSRNTYNSQSGQMTLCGGLTKKVVAFELFSKQCRTCQDFEAKTLDSSLSPPAHCCLWNWKESRKSMEPHGILACMIKVLNSGITRIRDFISDDNSSSRAALHHPNETNNKGRLPLHIQAILRFLVDPSHRRRVYGSYLYKLEKRLSCMKKRIVNAWSGISVTQ